jgi:hypothetical protein
VHYAGFSHDGARVLAVERDSRDATSGMRRAHAWDAASGAALGPCLVRGGLVHPNAPACWFPLRAECEPLDLTVRRAHDRKAVAWLPYRCAQACKHPQRRTWAAVAQGRLYLVALEGAEVPTPGRDATPRQLLSSNPEKANESVWNFCRRCGLLLPIGLDPTECPKCGVVESGDNVTKKQCHTCLSFNPKWAAYCSHCGAAGPS